MKKKMLIAIILIISILIDTDYVKAKGFNIGFAHADNGKNGENKENSLPEVKRDTITKDGRRIIGTAIYTITGGGSLNAQINSMDGIDVPEKYKFIAGTYMKVNITETRHIEWNITEIKYEEEQQLYKCHYSEKKCTNKYNGFKLCGACPGGCEKKIAENFPICKCYEQDHNSSTKEVYLSINASKEDCPGNATEIEKVKGSTKSVPYNGSVTKEFENKIISGVGEIVTKMIGGGPSINVDYINTNNYQENKKELPISNIKGTGSSTPEFPGGKKGSIVLKYYYHPNKVCINALNGNVYYDEDCNEKSLKCKKESCFDLYNYKEDGNEWPYFIPIDTKSNNEFYISFQENKRNLLTVSACENIMQNYKDYKNYIKQKNGGSYQGDYSKSKRYSHDYQNVKNDEGCYISTKINFNITQKFYNEKETEKSIIFDGFAFTYRPIDVNNPFPNGIDTNSYWKDWNKKNPKISSEESFKEATYVAASVNKSAVTEKEGDTPYTDWSTFMKIDGRSTFIDGNIITRGENVTYYKLGCGISNICKYLDKDHKKKNPLYQEECSLSDSKVKAGDVCP